jgi:hypothetical protein
MILTCGSVPSKNRGNMAIERTKKVTILAHPGQLHQPEFSAVQTSEGDKFAGDVVELPEGEVRLLVAAKRAEEYVEPKKGKSAA